MGPPLLQKLHRGSEDRILIVATSQTMLGETLIPTGVWQVPNSLCSPTAGQLGLFVKYPGIVNKTFSGLRSVIIQAVEQLKRLTESKHEECIRMLTNVQTRSD